MARDDEIGVKISLKDRARFQKDVRDSAKDIEGLGDSAKRAEGKSGGLMGVLSGIAGGAWTAAKRIGLLGAGIVTAFGGVAIAKGISRLRDIEDATASLNILLGDTAKTTEFLDEIMQVVTGTPYNFDQFAMAGKNFVAFGADIEKVPGWLTAIGEAAAASGGGAESVDRIVRSLGQATARGRITGDTILTLSEQGVPALQILANKFGVTTEAMSKMVSDGAVPAEEGIEALTQGIMEGTDGAAGATMAYAGSMEALRQTFSGALGGMGAATARFGAKIISPFMKLMTRGMGDASDLMDRMGDRVEVFSQRGADALERFIDGVAPRWEEFTLGFKDGLDETPWQKFGSVTRDTMTTVSGWFSSTGDVVGNLRDGFDLLVDKTETMFGLVESGMEGSWVRLKDVFWQVWDAVEELAGPIGNLGRQIGEATALVGVTTWDLFLTALELIADVLTDHVVPMVTDLIDFLGENQWIVDAAVGAWVLWSLTMRGLAFAHLLWGLGVSTIALWTNSAAWVANSAIAISSMGATVAILWLYAMDNIRAFAMATAAHARAVWMGVVMYARQMWGAITHAATVVWTSAVIVAKWVWMGIMSMAAGIKMAAAWFIALGPIGWAIALIILIAGIVIYYWDEIVAWTIQAWTTVSEWTVTTFTAIKDWIVEKFNEVISFFSGVGTRISEATRGMWDGIKNAFKSVINWIIDKWNGLSFGMDGFKAPEWMGGGTYGAFSIGTPNIPRLHKGGTVTGGGLTNIQPSEEIVMLPPAARVVPLPAGEQVDNSFLGGSEGTDRPMIAKVYLDRREIAEAVFEAAGDVVARR